MVYYAPACARTGKSLSQLEFFGVRILMEGLGESPAQLRPWSTQYWSMQGVADNDRKTSCRADACLRLFASGITFKSVTLFKASARRGLSAEG